MAEDNSGPWEALRRAYSPKPALAATHERVALPAAPSAPDSAALGDDLATRLDLAEERAAIMEHDGGLTRANAEARAFKAHGLALPKRTNG